MTSVYSHYVFFIVPLPFHTMKRLLWFICIPILLGALFLYLINHPQLSITQKFLGNFLNDANMHSGDMLDT